jgi:Raf kinase inhibitor-like YbhB/YbcL family protein
MLPRLAIAAILAAAMPVAAQGAPFAVTSSDFQDNAPAPAAGAQSTCGGANTSPALAWSGAPSGTKSFAIVMTDVDNARRVGWGTHWLAYGIPAAVTSIPSGFATQSPAAYVSGLNFSNQPGYRGYCPPKTDVPHHYVFTVLATDLPASALAPNLSREAFTAALTGHVLAASSIIAQYAQR